MSIPRVSTGLAGMFFACLASIVSGTQAEASAMTCGERGSSYRLINARDTSVAISVVQGDFVQWQVLSGAQSVQIAMAGTAQVASGTGSYATPANVSLVTLSLDDTSGVVAVGCVQGGKPGSNPYFSAGIVSANSQTYATNTGVGLNSKGRFGTGSNLVSQNTIFVSTSNMGANRFVHPDWNAWASLEGRFYSGGLDGMSLDFVGGIDRLVTPDLLVGVLGGFGRTAVADTGTKEVATSPMLGLYFGHQIETGLIVDGFLSFAKPAYDISGASFTADRQSLGLNVSGRVKRGGLSFEPFLLARGYRENQPGYTTGGGGIVGANQTSSFAASLGVKVAFEGQGSGNALVPYVSAAADYRVSTSTLAGTDRMIAPRIAVGLNGKLGQGDISLDVDFGKTRSDTYDRGIKLGYELKF
jgi:hypothetical protein